MRKLILTISLMVAGFAHAQTTVTLTAPNILGVACGGYQSGSKVTLVGFDANGNIQGTVYEIMSCSSGGRGSTPHRYTGTGVVTWDFRGGVITSYDAPLAIPAVGTSAVDNYGNVVTLGNPNLLQVALTIHQMPPKPDYVEALVPNLIGDTDAVARAAIAAAGLVDGGAYINYTYPAPAGTVFNQRPLAGNLAPFGTVIVLWETPASSSGGGGSGD
jgi:PASTA domain